MEFGGIDRLGIRHDIGGVFGFLRFDDHYLGSLAGFDASHEIHAIDSHRGFDRLGRVFPGQELEFLDLLVDDGGNE